MSLHLNFIQGGSFKLIMEEDVFYTAPKRVNPLKTKSSSSRNEIKWNSPNLGKKRKISLGFWQDISHQSFLLMDRRCLVEPSIANTHLQWWPSQLKDLFVKNCSNSHKNKHNSRSFISSQRKSRTLKNKEAYLVLDHAMYCKALIIMDPRNLELCNFVS